MECSFSLRDFASMTAAVERLLHTLGVQFDVSETPAIVEDILKGVRFGKWLESLRPHYEGDVLTLHKDDVQIELTAESGSGLKIQLTIPAQGDGRPLRMYGEEEAGLRYSLLQIAELYCDVHDSAAISGALELWKPARSEAAS